MKPSPRPNGAPASRRHAHYYRQELLTDEGGVQVYRGIDPLNGLPVRIYAFSGEPTAPPGRISTFIPVLLASSYREDEPGAGEPGAGEVVSAFSTSYQPATAPVSGGHVRALLRQTATALDDAAKAGIIHGDLRPERVFYVDEAERPDVPPRRRFLLEGYGVPWPLRTGEYSPPERIEGASYAGDIFSWAMTMRALAGPLPGEVRDLLLSCLDADPEKRPHARDLCAALARCSWHDPTAQAPPAVRIATQPPTDRTHAGRGPGAVDLTATGVGTAEPDAAEADATGAEKPNEHPTKPGEEAAAQPAAPQRERNTQEQDAQPLERAHQPPRRGPAAPQAGAFSGFEIADDEAERAADARLRDAFAPVRVVRDTPMGGSMGDGAVPTSQSPTSQLPTTEDARAGSEPHPAADADTEAGAAAQARPTAPSAPPDSALDDTLRRVDATAAYRERRAHYEAAQGQQDSKQDRGIPAVADESRFHRKERSRARREAFELEDFEVVDDIDDRAPDPTVPRGGLRVVLLSLLVIATLVLLALLFFAP
jgi:hypothetical protein